MQQVINGRQGTQQAKLFGEQTLNIDTAQRADLIVCLRSRIDSLSHLRFLLGGEWQARRAAPTILQAFQLGENHDSQSLGMRRILLGAFESFQFRQSHMLLHIHRNLPEKMLRYYSGKTGKAQEDAR